MNRPRTGLFLAAALAAAATASAKDVTVPKGTYLELTCGSAFDSEHVKKADMFTATVTRGLWVEGQLAIRAGSTVKGEIKSVRSSHEGAKSVQRALKGRNYYAGEATGSLDQATRDALARFQLDQGQSATGDADDVTVQALGVTASGLTATK